MYTHRPDYTPDSHLYMYVRMCLYVIQYVRTYICLVSFPHTLSSSISLSPSASLLNSFLRNPFFGYNSVYTYIRTYVLEFMCHNTVFMCTYIYVYLHICTYVCMCVEFLYIREVRMYLPYLVLTYVCTNTYLVPSSLTHSFSKNDGLTGYSLVLVHTYVHTYVHILYWFWKIVVDKVFVG